MKQGWPIEFTLWAGAVCGILGVIRMLLSISTKAWYDTVYNEVDALPNFSCEDFHRIQNKPRPWYVRINNWMEEHHV